MRFNGKELAAVALQPSHKFDKEGVLLIKEKQDGLFRRGEVDVPRFCRIRGNLLFYFKTTDLCSEPLGVFVLEQCAVSLANSSSEGPFSFHLTFDGDKTVHQFSANTEPERDSWIQVLHMASYQYMCSQLRALQEKLNSLQSRDEMSEIQSRMSRTKSMMDSTDEPFLEMSTACDNLLCDGNGTAPNPMLSVSVMKLPQTQWLQYAQTEIIERSSNPCFLTTVGFRTSDNINSNTKVKVSVFDVRERLTLTMTQLGSTVFTLSQLIEADKNKLRLILLSADNKTVGFVSVTAWQIESEATSSTHGSSGSNQESPQDEEILPEKARSQTLPAKLLCKSRISHHTQLNVLYDNAISQTYRFHTGLGADLSVLEIMAENKLSFVFPQALLTIFIKEEKDLLNNITVLGELKPIWNTRQVEEIERHLHLINSYTHALTYLDSYTGPYFKASAMKSDTNLEFVPVNLHLQRMWIQNDSTKKSGFYDVMTVGAFTAHSLKFKNGGLLRMINQVNKTAPLNGSSKKNNNGQNKLTRACAVVSKIRNLRQEMKTALDRLNTLAARKASTEIQIVMTDITNLAQQLTKLCDPLLIEEAYRMLEEVRLPQTDTNMVDNSNQQANSLSLLSNNNSPAHRPAPEFSSVEDDDLEMIPASSANQEEKSDSSKEWSIRKMQHRRSSSDARLYSEGNSDPVDADRHSLFNVRICEEEGGAGGSKQEKLSTSCPRSPSISQKAGWRLQKQASAKESGKFSSSPRSFGFFESNSMFSLLRKGGGRARHERSLINIGRSDSNPDSNKCEENPSLRKCKKTMSLRSLNGARIRSMSPDEPEPWDLTQLNIEASVMCMSSKIRTLCRHERNVVLGTSTESQPEVYAVSRDADWAEELRPSMKKLKQAIDCLLKTSRLTHCLFSLQESAEYTTLQCLIRYRRDVVFSQALTALVAAILTRLWCHRPDPAFLTRLCELGLLVEFEGLLSCYGDEMSMLEDMVIAIDDLKQVKFRLVRCDNSSTVVPEVGGSRSSLVVNLPVPDLVLTLVPMECQGTCEFRVMPAFFNIGINEQATFAEKFGDISLQEKINMDGSEVLEEFHTKYQAMPLKFIKSKKLNFSDCNMSVEKLIEKLKNIVQIRHSKNVEILHIAAEICRQLDGLRFTSCKSAKDRTSMSVTLEQCVVLEEQYDLAEPEFSHALDCMRCEGTRRENTLKNAGVMKYAFNSLQLMALPKQYRPPPGTYGNVQT